MTVWEKTLRDFKFELPSLGLRGVRSWTRPSCMIPPPRSPSAGREAETVQVSVGAREVQTFAQQFRHDYGIEIRFDEAATQALIERSTREGVPRRRTLPEALQGLPLWPAAHRAATTRKKPSYCPCDAVEEPDKYLSELVVASYRRAHSETTPTPT